jgi:hypothetical protein
MLELLNNSDNPMPVAPAPAGKKKRMTTEERLAKLQANIQAKAEKAAQRAQNAVARRTAKAEAKKADKAVARGAVANTLRNEIARMATNAHLSLTANNVKIPSKGAKAELLQKYFNAAKARYYKRTKKASSLQRRALEAAAAHGLNAKYVKFGRNKNIGAILQKADARRVKNTAKASKGAQRAAILAMADERMGLNEKELMSIVCVRKKVEKK